VGGSNLGSPECRTNEINVARYVSEPIKQK
jgi:hypothetical protein